MPSSFLLSSISYSKEVSYVVDEEPSKFVLKAQKRDPSGNCKVLDHTPKIYDNDSLLLVLFSWFSFIFVSLVVRFRRFFFFSFSFFLFSDRVSNSFVHCTHFTCNVICPTSHRTLIISWPSIDEMRTSEWENEREKNFAWLLSRN